MRHRRHHARAIFVEAAEPFSHSIESPDDSFDLSRPTRRNRWIVATCTEVIDRCGKLGKRLYQPPGCHHRQERGQGKGEDQPGGEADVGEFRRHRVAWRRRVQVGHDEEPLPVRKGSFDPRTVLDASTGRACFLVREPIAIGDDHRSRRAKSRFDAMAHRLRVRLSTIAQIRRGRVEQAKADLRKLGGGEDGRSVRDRRAIEDVEQCGHPARELQQKPFFDLGKLLPALEAEIGEHGGHHPLKGESQHHRNDDRERDSRGNGVRAPHHQGAPLRVTSAVRMYPSLRIVLISAGSLGSASRRWRSRLT